MALHDVDAVKAPRLDGFTIAFFKHHWNMMEGSVLQVFQEFFTHCKFEKSLNATFVTLIPKKPGSTYIRDFRPVSTAKFLANHLNTVSVDIFLDTHNVFIGGRQILDLVLITDERIDSRLREYFGDHM